MITEYSGTKMLTKSDMCEALGVARSSYYRVSSPKLESRIMKKPSARKLTEDEENKILGIVNSDRFCDMAPGEIFFTLLDEELYNLDQCGYHQDKDNDVHILDVKSNKNILVNNPGTN